MPVDFWFLIIDNALIYSSSFIFTDHNNNISRPTDSVNKRNNKAKSRNLFCDFDYDVENQVENSESELVYKPHAEENNIDI